MALSNEAPRDKLTSLQVLLDFTQALKDLSDNPDLPQMAKNAYALSDAEKAKAEEGRATITQYATATKALKDQQDATQETLDELADQQDALAKAQQKLTDATTALNTREKALTALASSLSEREKTLAQGQSDLAAGVDKLAQDNAALIAEKNRIDDYEDSLKTKAVQLQKLAQGL